MSRERVVPYAVAAVALAVLGLVATLWRPVAPAPGDTAAGLDHFGPEVLELVAAYRDPRRVGVLVVVVLTLAVPGLAVATSTGRRIVRRLAGDRDHAPGRAALIAAAVAVTVDLASSPVSVAFGYVQDGRYGFRTADALGWARDWLVVRAPGWGLAAVGAAALVVLIRRWPRSWHWRGALLGSATAAAVVLVAPLAFEPLLLRTEPLPDGPTRDAVAGVVERAGVADARIAVGDASRRTTKVNAYVSGLGPSRRVVLHDTLLTLPDEQIAAVVAHELAHRLHRDIERGVLLASGGALVTFLALRGALGSRRLRRLVDARGPTDPRLMALAAVVVAALWAASLPVVAAVSQRVEAAADHGALTLTEDPGTAVELARVFVVRDLADPEPPRWYRRIFASHPPPGERIRAAAAFADRHGIALPDRSEIEDRERRLRHPGLR